MQALRDIISAKPRPSGFLPELVFCAVCVAAVILLWQRAARNELFWGDEIVTARAIANDAGQIIAERYRQAHSPLYFIGLKAWASIATGLVPSVPLEPLLRLPSMIFMGLAGGFLSAAAWRMGGLVPAAVLFLGWLTHHFLGVFAIEARPYAFLMLTVALWLWSATRLWLSREAETSPWILGVSISAPILASATMVVGAIAVLVVEATCLLDLREARFRRMWLKRSGIVMLTGLVILAIFAPPIIEKAPTSWTQTMFPLSWANLRDVSVKIYTTGGWAGARTLVDLESAALVLLASAGLIFARDQLPVRMAAGLALGFPFALVAISTVSSLMIPRYFLPAAAGGLLLAAAGRAIRGKVTALAALFAIAMALLVLLLGHHERKPSLTVEKEIALLKKLRPVSVTGGATNWDVWVALDYYAGFAQVDMNLESVSSPLSIADLPSTGEPYWLFDGGGWPTANAIAGTMPVLCRYSVGKGTVLVLGTRREALPPAMRNC